MLSMDKHHYVYCQLWLELLQLKEKNNIELKFVFHAGDSLNKPTASYVRSLNESNNQLRKEFSDGCSLLHLACLTADIGMVELLLQYGANINAADSKGRTPLHHCVVNQRSEIAKLLLMR